MLLGRKQWTVNKCSITNDDTGYELKWSVECAKNTSCDVQTVVSALLKQNDAVGSLAIVVIGSNPGCGVIPVLSACNVQRSRN